jgi:hypothetical protein
LALLQTPRCGRGSSHGPRGHRPFSREKHMV